VSDSVYHHHERTIVWTISWELLIDPVADTSEPECYRDTYCKDISDLEESISISSTKKKYSQENSEKSTMETHASLPYREDL
jgi:hypothetical protein